jgi:hypothetical protein
MGLLSILSSKVQEGDLRNSLNPRKRGREDSPHPSGRERDPSPPPAAEGAPTTPPTAPTPATSAAAGITSMVIPAALGRLTLWPGSQQGYTASASTVKWTGSYLSLPSKTVAASGNTWDWEVGTNLPLSRQGSNLAALSAGWKEIGGAGMDKKDRLQCPCSVHPGSKS